MKKGILGVFIVLIVLLSSGCGKEEAVKLSVEVEAPYAIAELTIPITGNISNLKESYLFYQVEDGHGYLAEGKINIQPDGSFETVIELEMRPTNPYGTILFYKDQDGDGLFTLEADIREVVKSIWLAFDEKLVVPLSNVES